MSDTHSSKKAIVYALAANLGIAIAKGTAAVMTNSGSMLAEAVHSLADSANQGLLFFGLARAKRPATSDHPMGHGKAIYFWSFIVAVMLFSMGGLFSVYEGIHKLRAPAAEGLSHPWAAIAVLGVAILLEGGSLWGALRESREGRRGKSLFAWFRESRQSELLVVVGEDLGALSGLALALAAVLLTLFTGNPVFDACGSIAIGVLLIVIAVAVAIEVKSLLIGESAAPETVEIIRQTIATHPAVAEVQNLITLQFGSDIMVAVKARMREAPSSTALIEATNDCERAVKSATPAVRWTFFEPDVTD